MGGRRHGREWASDGNHCQLNTTALQLYTTAWLCNIPVLDVHTGCAYWMYIKEPSHCVAYACSSSGAGVTLLYALL